MSNGGIIKNMNRKLQKELLKKIKQEGGYQVSLADLLKENNIFPKYTNYGECTGKAETNNRQKYSKIMHNLHLLENQNICKIEEGNFNNYSEEDDIIQPWEPYYLYISILPKGYEFIYPWYKQFWKFVKNDLSKILSIIATLLSIISLMISLAVLFK
jgi:hypothetical protein